MSGTEAACGQAPRLVLHLDGFEGPLDLLLELARAQKVDLARISILALVEQYLAIIEEAARVRLELAADWLVMAAWLAWLKSRLLLPAEEQADAAEGEEGEEAAGLLARRLEGLERLQAAAGWLAARPQLGHAVFARGAPERLVAIDRSALSADLGGLVRAYVAARRRSGGRRAYVPRRRPFLTLAEARARLERLLGAASGWAALEAALPVADPDPVARRAAVASTLLAGLELARSGQAALRQDAPFGPILLRAAGEEARQ